jgi:zona occludens toxin (predicted ATPase)
MIYHHANRPVIGLGPLFTLTMHTAMRSAVRKKNEQDPARLYRMLRVYLISSKFVYAFFEIVFIV